MARSRYRLTPALQEQIVAYIRAGGYPHVAAEAAGLPREVFTHWLERGQRAKAPPAYREFARVVMEAHAQARLNAELSTMTDKPLDWLKAGPGRDNAGYPGWSNPGKPSSASAGGPIAVEVLIEVFALLGEFLKVLQPYPEARALLAAWIAKQRSPTRSRKMAPDGTD